MASETRATAESIRESARQVLQEYLAGRSVEGDDVANVAHDLDDAAAEIARLTAELEKTEAALTIAKTTAANLHDVIRRKDRELEEARERGRRLRDHAEAVAASALPPSRRTTRVGNEALAGLRRALASTPPDTEDDGGCTV